MSEADDAGMSGATYKLTLDGDGVKVTKEINADVAMEVLGLVVGGSEPATPSRRSPSRAKRAGRRGKAAGGDEGAKSRRRSGSPGVVKDLSLRPKGKVAFADFAKEKKPRTHQQKQLVIVYWLQHEAGMSTGITADHVNTCYQAASWKRPNDLENSLSVTSVKKGWLDTSDRSNIKVTVPGEDFVEHELPPSSEG